MHNTQNPCMTEPSALKPQTKQGAFSQCVFGVCKAHLAASAQLKKTSGPPQTLGSPQASFKGLSLKKFSEERGLEGFLIMILYGLLGATHIG